MKRDALPARSHNRNALPARSHNRNKQTHSAYAVRSGPATQRWHLAFLDAGLRGAHPAQLLRQGPATQKLHLAFLDAGLRGGGVRGGGRGTPSPCSG